MKKFTEDGLYLDKWVENSFVKENSYLNLAPEDIPLPVFNETRDSLPAPFWEGHEAAISCWWKAWELAFNHLRKPVKENGFVSNYIDTAFNNNLFMWDSCFILMFGRYGRRGFDFQKTLDNLYAHQHPDGFISREIREINGQDQFHRFDPSSTGPNVLAWCEWENYLNKGDKERLSKVFPSLAGYHEWMRTYRTWPDGTSWSTGWGCGMDNQPRTPEGTDPIFQNGHMSWIDATCQQIISAKFLDMMAKELNLEKDRRTFSNEAKQLATIVNQTFWDNRKNFYFDRLADGSLSKVMSIAGYWSLLAGIVPENRIDRFIAHLDDPKKFKRMHRVPALSADQHAFNPNGDYWNGGIWPPTNYMLLRGLSCYGLDDLASEIALNHHQNVVEVFSSTGTLWENYSPDSPVPGQPAKKDFVGWGGVPPIAVFLEYVIGLRPDAPANRLLWDIRLKEEHGVKKYPFGADGLLDLKCNGRKTLSEKPVLTVSSNRPIDLEIRWAGNRDNLHIPGQSSSTPGR